MLNRSQAPDYQAVKGFKFVQPHNLLLENQTPCFVFEAGSQPIVNLQLIFEVGKFEEGKAGVASFCGGMWLEGTKNKTAAELVAQIDHYGAAIHASSGSDFFTLELLCLKKHFEPLLLLFVELLKEQQFPEKELRILKSKTLQNLKISLEKTSFLASRSFSKQLFGNTHPYTQRTEVADIEAIEQVDIQHFYQKHIQNNAFRIIAAGQIGDSEIELIEKYLGKLPASSPQQADNQAFALPKETKKIYLAREDALQTTLRLGKHLFNRKHPDYVSFVLCNMVLGGYFGSRLMQNIREDKGFTYGIHSSMRVLKNAAYWAVRTDVKKANREEAVAEIYKEIQQLQQELVPIDELQRAKNYIAGNFLNALSTPFALASKFRTVLLQDLPSDYYDTFLPKIEATSPQDLQRIAQTHLTTDLIEVLVG